METRAFRIRHTSGSVSSELPITVRLAGILDRGHAACEPSEASRRLWVFPSPTSAFGRLRETKHLYRRLSERPVPNSGSKVCGTVIFRSGARPSSTPVADQPTAQSQSGRRGRRWQSRKLDYSSTSPSCSARCQSHRRTVGRTFCTITSRIPSQPPDHHTFNNSWAFEECFPSVFAKHTRRDLTAPTSMKFLRKPAYP